MLLMSEKKKSSDRTVKLSALVSPRVHRALLIHSARKNISVGEVIEEFVFEYLQRALELADEAIAEDSLNPHPPRRGRPPRGD